jgi:hypothetical protein
MNFIHRLTDDELLRELHHAIEALPDAPPAMQRAAIDLWAAGAPRVGLVATAGALVQRVLAVLSFDSWAAPTLAHGMRSLRAPTRHLLFNAEGRDIDLRVIPHAQGFSLAGQVLGPDDAGAVELVASEPSEPSVHRCALDSLGAFRLDDLKPGVYSLTLRLGADEIVLPSIDVGQLAP